MKSSIHSASYGFSLLPKDEQEKSILAVDEIVAMFLKKELNIVQMESILDYVKQEIRQYKISE